MKLLSTIGPVKDSVRFEVWREQWKDKDRVGFGSYVSSELHPEDALIFSKLLFPNFVEVDDCVLLEDRFDLEIFSKWMKEMGGATASVEQVLNHTHIYDVFGGCKDDVSDSIFEQLGKVIAFSWEVALKKSFPTRSFCVSFSFSEADYGPVVTFWQGQ